MPEETNKSKAQKLAAAKKKLKEFQKRGGASHDNTTATASTMERSASPALSQEHPYSTSSISSNLSERSESELNLNGHGLRSAESENITPIAELAAAMGENVTPTQPAELINTAANYFSTLPQQQQQLAASFTALDSIMPIADTTGETSLDKHFVSMQEQYPVAEMQASGNLNAIQVLITEKAQLTSEVNKYRTMCRERDFELEELRTLYTATTQRLEELQHRFVNQQQSTEQLRHTNAELQHKLAQINATLEDQATHIEELKQQLNIVELRATTAEQQFKEKANDLEMSQLRIRQLSDETNISTDNRVETLTQTQFMYEQQIRDLQAMVQQLTQDKEQANLQYQNYVQHLNIEVNNLNERNAELMDECTKLQERERQLIDHISGLERDIQKNISRQDLFKAAEEESEKKQGTSETVAALTTEIERLNEKLSDYEFEKHEFQLKIKSQEERLQALTNEMQKKQTELQQYQEQLEHINEEQPDKVKLLATMESDKVAASRALTQNVAMKQQLDELEIRFVQLTNDKAELVNRLDAEEYANREMRTNYAAMEERLNSTDERYKYKDEEMIRLSHENMELIRKNLILQQQMDRLKHYEVQGYNAKYATETEAGEDPRQHNEHEHQHEHDNHDHHEHDHDHEHNHKKDDNNKTADECDSTPHETDSCHEANEEQDQHAAAAATTNQQPSSHHAKHEHHHHHCDHAANKSVGNNTTPPHIPSEEAVEKLQQRFTHLMSQVADLTDEKQRLEHLVLQLQGETETIGEYITLYQNQRRILKQREYEKAAQTKLLQEEREQMRDKINLLNNLVSSLGVELPHNNAAQLKQHFNAALADSVVVAANNTEQRYADATNVANNHAMNDEQQQQLLAETSPLNEKLLKSAESQQILTKIQNIITEIKEDTTKEVPTVPLHTADHLNCCLGKFEVV